MIIPLSMLFVPISTGTEISGYKLKDIFFWDIFYVWISFFANFCLKKGSEFAFRNSQYAFFDRLLLKCSFKIGHCPVFYTHKPGFRWSNPVAANFRFFKIFNSLITQSIFDSHVCNISQNKAENKGN